jgi:hypothetical protein
MGAPGTPPSRGRAGAVLAAVLAAAVILGGAAVVALTRPDGPRPAAPGAGGSTPGFAGGGDVTVLYAVRQRTEDGSAPVVLLRNAGGDLRLCDAAGPDAPAQAPVPEASGQHPVVVLTQGRSAGDCSGTTVDGDSATLWLAVDPQVERVQQRYVVRGHPGPWFSTTARDGFAHLQTWLAGPLDGGAALAVQQRVLDATGAPLAQDALPTRRQPLAGCAGGDAQIG